MVWQVQQLSYLTLTDITIQGPVFRIKLAETENPKEPGLMEIKRPFGLYDPTGIRKYDLILDENKGGLVKQIYSRLRLTAEEIQFSEAVSVLSDYLKSKGNNEQKIIEIRRKIVGYSDFEDFKIFGEYAVNRFPHISNEASLDSSGLQDLLDFEESEHLNELRFKGKLDHNYLQNRVISTFHDVFKKTAIERAGFPITRGGFNIEQIRELIKLVTAFKRIKS